MNGKSTKTCYSIYIQTIHITYNNAFGIFFHYNSYLQYNIQTVQIIQTVLTFQHSISESYFSTIL